MPSKKPVKQDIYSAYRLHHKKKRAAVVNTAAFFILALPKNVRNKKPRLEFIKHNFAHLFVKFAFLIVCLLALPFFTVAQQATVYGKITDESGRAIELAHIAVSGQAGGVTSSRNGQYEIRVPHNEKVRLLYSFVGFRTHDVIVELDSGERMQLDITLQMVATELPAMEVRDRRIRSASLTRLDPREAQLLPTVSGGVEDLIKTLPGVSSGSELSSQYTVRGGNFDENLVYVNDIEIYRPFLVRSGQQEGLSFLNSSLVSSILFSAGGFGAEYGDRMSSVLDITYKRPDENRGSFSASLLGADLHVEGRAFGERKFSYLMGARYKTTQYILQAMETQGAYRPDFTDIQTLLMYEFSSKWEISALGYYSRNQYKLVPESRQTDFGTFDEAFRLSIFFDGQEVDRYRTGMGALTLTHRPHSELELKLIGSAYSTFETETYDLLGQYWIGRLETSAGSEQFGNVVQSQGVGTFLEHARNYFDASVINIDHKGAWVKENHTTKWGVRYQWQQIDDRIHEWEMIDSAGFTLPRPIDHPGTPNPQRPDLVFNHAVSAHNQLQINRINAYLQHSRSYLSSWGAEYTYTLGVRGNYWDYADELLISPRLSFAYKPAWRRDMVFRFASGYYHQPPFYREMRLFDGSLYPDAKSQQSIHFVLGSDWNFEALGRSFMFSTEVYYKLLDKLVPYEVDNVSIRYYADQTAKGYAAGVDFKLFGEFVKGVESWATLSFMKTEEDIAGDFYYNYYDDEGGQVYPGFVPAETIVDSLRVSPGMIPRPGDQRFQFSIFFQDYIPGYPSYKVHLNLLYGSSLPFGPPNEERYKHVLRMPSYRRVDIGFSKQIIGAQTSFRNRSVFRHIENMWVSLEVFNLFQVSNTVSYIWVKDVNNRQYAIPNYLTPRQLNLKLVVEF